MKNFHIVSKKICAIATGASILLSPAARYAVGSSPGSGPFLSMAAFAQEEYSSEDGPAGPILGSEMDPGGADTGRGGGSGEVPGDIPPSGGENRAGEEGDVNQAGGPETGGSGSAGGPDTAGGGSGTAGSADGSDGTDGAEGTGAADSAGTPENAPGAGGAGGEAPALPGGDEEGLQSGAGGGGPETLPASDPSRDGQDPGAGAAGSGPGGDERSPASHPAVNQAAEEGGSAAGDGSGYENGSETGSETGVIPGQTDGPGSESANGAENGSESEEDAGSEPEMSSEGETVTETASEGDPEAVTENTTESEAETESETETETETETEKEAHSILFEAQAGVTFDLKGSRRVFEEGEEVTFDVITQAGYDLDQVKARTVLILSEEEVSGSAGLGAALTGASPEDSALVLIEGRELPLTQTGSVLSSASPETEAAMNLTGSADLDEPSSFPGSAPSGEDDVSSGADLMSSGTEESASDGMSADTFTFIMPDEDVLLEASSVLAAPASSSVELSYGGIKNIPRSWTPDGQEWAAGRTIIGYSVYRKVTMPDGKERVCYCLQPVLGADDAGTYTARRITGNALLQKALFYSYGGPGWNSGGIKNVLSDCSDNDEYYVASHFILSQIYVGENGKWNKVISEGVEYPAMNARGEAQVSAAVKAIGDLPAPTASLSTTQISGTCDASTGYAVTQSVTYSSSVSGNTLKITLPENVTLVTDGTEYGQGQTAVLNPGASFYLKKNGYGTAHSQTLTLTAAIATDFAAYLINVGADRQNMGFSYVADKKFSLQVDWPNLLTSLSVEKVDSVTGSAVPANPNYTLDGAVYGIYTDEGRSQLLETLTISNGSATSSESYVIGETYYIAEISAGEAYQVDPRVYPVTAAAGGTAKVSSADVPKALSLGVRKTDLETGGSSPLTSALTFAGARFAVYSDAACQTRAKDMNGNTLDDLVTGADGTAATPRTLLIADYWIRELAPPEGYLPSTEVFHVSASEARAAAAGENPSVTVSCAEQIIRGNVSIMKILNDRSQNTAAAQGIRFRFTYVKDPSIGFTVSQAGGNLIVTDAEGYATTESDACPKGTLIYGEWQITEENPPEGYEPILPATVMVSTNGRTYRFTASDSHIYASILLEKRDANTGSLLPVGGVSFSIVPLSGDGAGQPLQLFDPVSRSYESVWTTDADGMVQLPDSIPYGTYLLCEDPDTVPEGYFVMENTPFSVTERSDDPLSPLVITAEEPPQTGRISVRKKEAGTEKPLEGFTFLIRAAESITDMTGAVRTGENAEGEIVELTAGTEVDRITTGADGNALSKDLFPGKYEIEEVEGADGYAVLSQPQTVTLAPDRDAAAAGEGVIHDGTVFENHPTTVLIRKKEAGSGQALEGVTFRIREIGEGGDSGSGSEGSGKTEGNGSDGPGHTGESGSGGSAGAGDAGGFEGSGGEDNGNSSGSTNGSGSSGNAGENAGAGEGNAGTHADQDGIPGGQLCVTDAAGMIRVEKLKSSTAYEVRETASLPGYNPDPTPVTFRVDGKGLIDGDWQKELVFTNVPNILTVSKQSITGGEEIPGANLVIKDSSGKEVYQWTSTDTPHVIRAIPAGDYTLTETLPAPGYTTAETIRFTVTDSRTIQHVTMKDDVTKVQITKSDITNGQPLEGATLIITDSAGTEAARWVTTKEPHYIEKLPVGSYTLTEITAPAGYVRAESVGFEVTDSGQIHQVEMKDDVTKVQITKDDITNGQPVEGATLIITDSAGTEVARWQTTKEPHYIEKLPVGTYTLTELTAPKGYQVAESVGFSVLDSGDIQQVVMHDTPEEAVKKPKKPKKSSPKTGPARPAPPPGPSSVTTAPKTGDETNLAAPLLAALLGLMVIALTAGLLAGRRKRR